MLTYLIHTAFLVVIVIGEFLFVLSIIYSFLQFYGFTLTFVAIHDDWIIGGRRDIFANVDTVGVQRSIELTIILIFDTDSTFFGFALLLFL